jgi:hypothetical protein
MTGTSDLPHDVEAPTSAVADGTMPSTEKRGNTMRMLAASLALVLVSFAALSGCATIEENPRTAIGTGVGAASGALAGGLISHGATGAVVGGLIGALAGGGIGYYLDHQEKTRTQAVNDTGYTPAQGNVVRVDRVLADPATLHQGGTVNMMTTYTVLTPRAEDRVTVRETREVRRNGVLLANPTNEIVRANGTFSSTLPITLPSDGARGTYEVTTTVAVGDRSSHGISTFVVR